MSTLEQIYFSLSEFQNLKLLETTKFLASLNFFFSLYPDGSSFPLVLWTMQLLFGLGCI